MDFVIKKILGYTSLLNFRLLRFFIEGCVSCSSFLGDERIIFASRWWKADEIRTRSWQNGGKCCEIVNSSNWYFYSWSINDRMIGCYSFQRALDNLTSFHEMLIKSLFKFVQGAAHMWDLHEIGLARQERKLQVQ